MSLWEGALLDIGWRTRKVATKEDLRDLLVAAVQARAHDIIIQTGHPVYAQVDGVLSAVTERWLQPAEAERLAQFLSQVESIAAKLKGAKDFDVALQFEQPGQVDASGETERYRFRANITGVEHDGALGLQVVLRHIASNPPSPTDISLEREILTEATPAQGAVLLVGETGSGKTTTTAALKRHVMEGHTALTGNILTYESPVEFTFSRVKSTCCTIAQHDVPKNLPGFAEAVRNAMRRNPCLVEIQELRDPETITSAVVCVTTGHPLYATVHANSVAHVFQRLARAFPTDLQDPAYYDLISATHLIVSQVLVPRVGGGRVCLREWQVVTEDLRKELGEAGLKGAFVVMHTAIQRGEGGRSMRDTVFAHLAAGRIEAPVAARALDRYGYRRDAAKLRDLAPRHPLLEQTGSLGNAAFAT